MDIQTILSPVDLSTCSLLHTRQLGGLAAKLGAKLVLLHVVSLPEGVPADALVLHDGVESTAEDYALQAAARRLEPLADEARALGVAVEVVIREGAVIPTILAYAEERRPDLVALSTHGRTGLAKMMLGSVADAVYHGVSAPVLLSRRAVRVECHRDSCAWCPEAGRGAAVEALEAEAMG